MFDVTNPNGLPAGLPVQIFVYTNRKERLELNIELIPCSFTVLIKLTTFGQRYTANQPSFTQRALRAALLSKSLQTGTGT